MFLTHCGPVTVLSPAFFSFIYCSDQSQCCAGPHLNKNKKLSDTASTIKPTTTSLAHLRLSGAFNAGIRERVGSPGCTWITADNDKKGVPDPKVNIFLSKTSSELREIIVFYKMATFHAGC